MKKHKHNKIWSISLGVKVERKPLFSVELGLAYNSIIQEVMLTVNFPLVPLSVSAASKALFSIMKD